MTTMLDAMTILDEAPVWRESDAGEAGFGSLDTVRGGLPLQRLAVSGRITGLVYRLAVTQTFVNAHAEPLEATYIFPLPARAGVTRFRLRVGERVIEGVLKERGAAREEYDRAIRQGHRAAIAEEERPEVFTVRAGNIPPGEAVTVELELAGPLAVTDGEATFRFPLVVAPRYIPGVPLDGPGVGLGTAPDTDAVPDASRITPPVLLPGQPNPVHLEFRLELDPAGLPPSDLRASLHALRLGQTVEGLRVVELTPGAERLDRDIILRFRVGEETIRGGISVHRDPDGEVTALLTVAPPASLPATFRPRDVVVVLDRSGSMGGWKMAAARRAAARLIDTLTERDRFGLILFDDRLEEPAPSAGRLVPATDRARFRAVEFLARVEARGGTEIAPALTRALGYFPRPAEPDRERILLFVTDGQVGNEDQLLRQVHQQARDCRIFTVGIDRAVNASLLERLAGYGGGHCALVESEDRLDEVLRAVHRRLGAPLLTDLRLEPTLDDLAPDATDLFPGVPLRLGGRWSGSVPARFTVTGRTPEGAVFQQTLVPVETPDSAARTIWARARVLDLEHRFAAGAGHDAGLAEAIAAFSLKYGVLCRFTAFVAVDRSEVVNSGGEVHQVVQAVELPAEWAMPVLACAPPPMAPMVASMGMTSRLFSAGIGDYPGYPREDFPMLAEPPAAAPQPTKRLGVTDRVEVGRKRSMRRPAQPVPLPPWFERLETGLNAPVPDSTELLAALREALVALDALGKPAAELVREGRAIARRFEGDEDDARVRLEAWSRRVREWLEQPPGRKRRWFWWK
ncbi:MAG: VIT domain-containing protein [Candidatus Competibacteraceae bacterium]